MVWKREGSTQQRASSFWLVQLVVWTRLPHWEKPMNAGDKGSWTPASCGLTTKAVLCSRKTTCSHLQAVLPLLCSGAPQTAGGNGKAPMGKPCMS